MSPSINASTDKFSYHHDPQPENFIASEEVHAELEKIDHVSSDEKLSVTQITVNNNDTNKLISPIDNLGPLGKRLGFEYKNSKEGNQFDSSNAYVKRPILLDDKYHEVVETDSAGDSSSSVLGDEWVEL